MWICGRRKGLLIREIWSPRRCLPLPLQEEDNGLKEDEKIAYEALQNLDKPTLKALIKRHSCIPVQREKEYVVLIAVLKHTQTEHIKPICAGHGGDETCINPEHWNLIYKPEIPNGINEDADADEESEKKNPPSEDQFSLTTAGSAMGRFGNDVEDPFPWCKLAYWEECLRVGPQFPVFDSSVDVFSEFLKGSGLSLSSIFTQNRNPSSSTRETRKKIGRGLSLSQESNGVWIHNKSSSSIFVNSPTLDFHPLTGKFIVYKLLPGHSLLVFDYGVSGPLLRKRNHSVPRLDVCSVRVSFAKGWGANYKRPNVTNCPCWLEIMLLPPVLLS